MKRKLIFFGAGRFGARALDKFHNEDMQSYDFAGFFDNHKSGEYCGYPIKSLEEYDKDVIVVMTLASERVALDIHNKLYARGYREIFWYQDKVRNENTTDFLEKYCVSCKHWGDSPVYQVEMHVIDYCNLNCRGCTHYSSIFPKEIPNTADRIRDVEKLREKFSHILHFFLLGGEPFLHPDIIEYVEQTRKILPETEIQIVTNGLLIPKLNKEVFDAIRDNNVIICISEYEPTHRNIDVIKKVLEENNVCYVIRPYDSKQKFNKPLSLSENSQYPFKCISGSCITIWKGKIARCPSVMYIDVFNEKFGVNLPNEGIISLDSELQGSELLEELRKDIPLCKHCIENEIEWSSCGMRAELTDFATHD